MPDDSSVFGDGLFGGPLFGGAGTSPASSDEVGFYGKTVMDVIPCGETEMDDIPGGEMTW